MEEYHGILVDVSQKDVSIFDKLKILGKRKTTDQKWTLYKLCVDSENIDRTIKRIQENMIKGFYFHLYKNDELIVVFKDKIFKVKTDKSTWKNVVKYGKSLNISEKQLDFFPCKIEDETY